MTDTLLSTLLQREKKMLEWSKLEQMGATIDFCYKNKMIENITVCIDGKSYTCHKREYFCFYPSKQQAFETWLRLQDENKQLKT